MSFAAGSRRDFGRRDFCFSARILARFVAGSQRDFGRRDFCFLARILARFAARSWQDFGRREFRFLARILPGSWRDSRREEKSQLPKSRRDPGRIPAEIAAGSRQDPNPYFTRAKANKLFRFSEWALSHSDSHKFYMILFYMLDTFYLSSFFPSITFINYVSSYRKI